MLKVSDSLKLLNSLKGFAKLLHRNMSKKAIKNEFQKQIRQKKLFFFQSRGRTILKRKSKKVSEQTLGVECFFKARFLAFSSSQRIVGQERFFCRSHISFHRKLFCAFWASNNPLCRWPNWSFNFFFPKLKSSRSVETERKINCSTVWKPNYAHLRAWCNVNRSSFRLRT